MFSVANSVNSNLSIIVNDQELSDTWKIANNLELTSDCDTRIGLWHVYSEIK